MRFLIDEMFSVGTSASVEERGEHTAQHVRDVGLGGAPDHEVTTFAREHGCVVVTENVADFAAEEELVVVFVLKRRLPAGGGQAAALADVLCRWADEHPQPYVGHHWPT